MTLQARVALYYAPAQDDPLWSAGCAWLGRDPETDAPLRQPELPGIAAITADARLYGFHATLKAPMRLALGWDSFMADLHALADVTAPFPLPPLAVADLSGFLALRETIPCPPLHALSDACTAALDPHRVPASAEELARRRAAGLSPEREAMLLRWGYPSAFATWRFHMTLTRRLIPEERAIYDPAARAAFAHALGRPRTVDAICVFAQIGPGQPFKIAGRVPLRGRVATAPPPA